MSDFGDIILDSSQQNLEEVPVQILQMSNLKMLYLQKNKITKLPWDFFVKLNQLAWLDLRNNQLETIPRSIGHHQHLENLLLSDNKIQELPNELGLLPRLKVLQIANNPLTYPNSKIVAEGTRSVCSYLKYQYQQTILGPPKECEEVRITREERELREEKELRVVEDFGREIPVEESINSSLVVRGLSKKEDTIIHRLSKDPSNKLLLKSYYDDEDNYARASTQTSDYSVLQKETLKQNWMDKLKQLLDEQEKILQQERLQHLIKLLHVIKRGVRRNLQVLSSWRQKKAASCPIRQEEPPYATYPEYNTILSRADITKQIDKLVERHKNPPKHEDVQKLINDLISQLKNMEVTYDEIKSPRSEIEASGNQINKIMEIHKKLLKLQQVNNTM